MSLLSGISFDRYAKHNSPTEHLIGELSDKNSLWYDLRLAEMSGYDYVFAPDAVCRQMVGLKALADFFSNLKTILGSPVSRTLLIGYWHDRYRELHFDKYVIDWSDDIAISWRKLSLDDSPQQEFIRTLFDHSEKLILDRTGS